jgi:hypothetical protein
MHGNGPNLGRSMHLGGIRGRLACVQAHSDLDLGFAGPTGGAEPLLRREGTGHVISCSWN